MNLVVYFMELKSHTISSTHELNRTRSNLFDFKVKAQVCILARSGFFTCHNEIASDNLQSNFEIIVTYTAKSRFKNFHLELIIP